MPTLFWWLVTKGLMAIVKNVWEEIKYRRSGDKLSEEERAKLDDRSLPPLPTKND